MSMSSMKTSTQPGKIEARLTSWETEVERLKDRIEKIAKDARETHKKETDEIQAGLEDVRGKLESLKTADKGTWDDAEKVLKGTVEKLKRAIDTTVSKLG